MALAGPGEEARFFDSQLFGYAIGKYRKPPRAIAMLVAIGCQYAGLEAQPKRRFSAAFVPMPIMDALNKNNLRRRAEHKELPTNTCQFSVVPQFEISSLRFLRSGVS